MIRTIVLSTVVALSFSLSLSARAAVIKIQVIFSGGNGAPLTVTLPQAVTATVTNDTANPLAAFVIQGVGNALGTSTRAATGALSYTTNGASPTTLDSAGSFNLGAATTNDLTLFRQGSAGVNLNDVLLLSSGSLTTTTNVTAAPPASGLYTAILVDNGGVLLGVVNPTPEPTTLGLFAVAAGALLRRHRRARPQRG